MKKKKQRLIKEQAQEWLKSIKSRVEKSSYSTYQYIVIRHILPNLGECNVDDVEENQRLMREKLQGYSKATISGVLIVLNQIVKLSDLPEPKKENDDTEKKMEILPNDQFQMFFDEVKRDIDPTKLGVLCVIYTGMKVGELCSLRWKNIDLINCKIKVNKTVQRIGDSNEVGKTILEEKEIPVRYIPIPTNLLRILLTHQGRINDFVLTGTSKQIEPKTAQNRLVALCRKIGLCTSISYTKLRDYFAVNAVANGVNVAVVADILGLECYAMLKYVKAAKKMLDMDNEIDKLNHI